MSTNKTTKLLEVMQQAAATWPGQDGCTEANETAKQLVLQYAGVIGFLCDISTHITDEDEQYLLDKIVADWCALSGWSWRRMVDLVEVSPP